MTLTKQDTIEKLLGLMESRELAAGEACNSSEGAVGCDEANQLLHIRKFIENFIK